MSHGAGRLLSLWLVLVMVCPFAGTPVSAAGGEGKSQPAGTAVETGSSRKEVDVAVTPPEDITFGQIPGDPSAEQVDRGRGTDEDGSFTYRYVGVEGTDYDSEKKPLGAGKYQVVATLNSSTHRGEGVSETFTIHKIARETVRRTITVPTNGGSRTVSFQELNLYSGMLKGAEVKKMPRVISSEVLRSVSLTSGGTALALKINAAQDGRSQNFRFVLTSDNYEELTVIVSVAVSITADELEITGLKVREPGVFAYGTALKDIIDLEDCAAAVNGQSASGTFELAEPEKCYDVGESTGVALKFVSEGREYAKTVPAEFTIQPNEAAFQGWDEAFIRDGYWITTYANSPYNTDAENLLALVQDRKESFTVARGRKRILLDAIWSADSNNPPFEPQGQKPHQVDDIIWYDWYGYTAGLTSQTINVKNLSVSGVQPKAYIRVVPVVASTGLAGDSLISVSAASIAGLTEKNWRAGLGLPETASVSYEPVEQPAWSDVYIPTPDGTYTISGWQVDGEEFTLAALQAAGTGKLTLTPVYADVPAWATITDVPTVELTITP